MDSMNAMTNTSRANEILKSLEKRGLLNKKMEKKQKERVVSTDIPKIKIIGEWADVKDSDPLF